jgi:5-methylcytosine-specific restriction endonuclease McrA
VAQTRVGAIKIFCNRIGITTDFYYSQLDKGLKWCTKCKEWRNLEDYTTDNSRYDKKRSTCNFCVRVKVKKSLKGRPSPMKGKTYEELHGPEKAKQMRDKQSRERSGSGNWNYRGGTRRIFDAIRSTTEHKSWRERVLERDGHMCTECGETNRLEVDHIKTLYSIVVENHISTVKQALLCEELFDDKNGRVLCRDCHKKTPTYGLKTIVKKKNK